MRKLTIVVVAIFVALVVIAGSIGGYLWYSTRQQVEQLVTMAKPFAEISYGGIAISPAGSVGVNQVRIMPHFANESLAVGSIRLNAPNILALLNIRRQLRQGQLPEAMSVSFNQIKLPLNGGILDATSSNPEERKPLDNLATLGCGSVDHFGDKEWRQMGFEAFVGNVETGYRLDTGKNLLNLRVDSNTLDWATLNLDIGLALSQASTSLMELASALTPKLAALNFVFRDDGFNARWKNFCAAQAGKPVEAFIADHVRLVVERLRANGIDPGPGLIDAYRRYLTEGGEFTFAATPPRRLTQPNSSITSPKTPSSCWGLS